MRKARELIAPVHRWTQGQFAATREGERVSTFDHEAYKFCAYGALRRAAFDLGHEYVGPYETVSTRIASKLCPGHRPLHYINDEDGHAAVLALFDKALKS